MTKFISKYKHYKLVMVPTRKDFVGGMPNIMYGKSIVFKTGEYETDKKDEIDFMRNHPDFNRVLFEIEDKTIEEEIAKPEIIKTEIIISEPVRKRVIKRKIKRTVKSKTKVG